MTQSTELLEETNSKLKRDLQSREEMIKSQRELIFKQECRLKQYETMHLELYNLKIELLDAKSTIEEKNKIITRLEITNQQLTAENSFLKYPNRPVRTSPGNDEDEVTRFLRESVQEIGEYGDGLRFSERTLSLNDWALHNTPGSLNQEQSIIKQPIIETVKETQKKKQNPPTLADKLKQTWTQPQQVQLSPVTPRKLFLPQSPVRVVVKETIALKLPKDKTRSLMIRGLYRGLKNDDLTKYFSQFGTPLGITSPPCVAVLDEGTKYAFMKFAEYEAVEKAMAQQFHVIKGIKVVTKKAKDFV